VNEAQGVSSPANQIEQCRDIPPGCKRQFREEEEDAGWRSGLERWEKVVRMTQHSMDGKSKICANSKSEDQAGLLLDALARR
jgi:hypothetical protein